MYIPNTQILYDLGVLEPNSEQDDLYIAWLDSLRGRADKIGPTAPAAAHFWIIIRVKKKGYGDKITFHEKVPMMIPEPGHGDLYAIATSKEEVDRLTSSDGDEFKASFVYLVYKIRIPGADGWRGFLDLMAENNLVEKELNG